MRTDKPTSDSKSGQGVLTPTRIAVAALAVLGLVFIFENTRQVRIRLIIPEVTMPLWLALLGVAVIGGVCGAFLFRRRK
ncbi:LapA family protein [Streptomyces sp. H39-S7]|uniref:LapA family protein n=1 Tax=Streptomyces sp. H39-S7 TaxID=3004357 RepID=UPI0022B03CDB|nr:LapA family protein [Streptomyces sp. H39-S7]MCZ4119198.1 LapA family protein [Streptomyces sp. H39-S7]